MSFMWCFSPCNHTYSGLSALAVPRPETTNQLWTAVKAVAARERSRDIPTLSVKVGHHRKPARYSAATSVGGRDYRGKFR